MEQAEAALGSGVRVAERESAELARLRERLETADQALREARAKSRAQVEEYKSENATLRRKLGESRTSERQARETAEEALSLAEEARSRTAALERSRTRRSAGCVRGSSSSRPSRPTGAARSAVPRAPTATRPPCGPGCCSTPSSRPRPGCGASWGCPPVSGAPADRVEAGLAEPVDDARTPGVSAVLGPGSASVLEQLLALPRVPAARRRLQRQQERLGAARRSRRSASGCSARWRRSWPAPVPRRPSSSTRRT